MGISFDAIAVQLIIVNDHARNKILRTFCGYQSKTKSLYLFQGYLMPDNLD
jgi:hypothetical protein